MLFMGSIQIFCQRITREPTNQIHTYCHLVFYSNSPDTQYIYVNVGFGFHAQLTLDEALTFISKKEVQLSKYVEAGLCMLG